MSIIRRKSSEVNKILYYDNKISNIFTPHNGIIQELTEQDVWLLSGNNIYNSNSGNVGVGLKNPSSTLDVSGVINSSSAITINHVPISPPIGSIIAYTVSTSPLGWLICDGTAVNRNTYAALFNIIGTTFGSGDNANTFNLPNYKGAFLRGTGTNGNYSGPNLNTSQYHATQTHSHTATSMVNDPGHAHTQYTINDDFNNSGSSYAGTTPSFPKSDSAGTKTWDNINSHSTGLTVSTTIGNNTTSVDANETRPYNYGVYWIIKY